MLKQVQHDREEGKNKLDNHLTISKIDSAFDNMSEVCCDNLRSVETGRQTLTVKRKGEEALETAVREVEEKGGVETPRQDNSDAPVITSLAHAYALAGVKVAAA